jgi:hypothetical protein
VVWRLFDVLKGKRMSDEFGELTGIELVKSIFEKILRYAEG